jgi:predicted RNA binding protein YcfA (HicA-like mRNA interferase family)
MTSLPVVSGRQAAKALEGIGCQLDRRRGSHPILRRSDPPFRRLTIRPGVGRLSVLTHPEEVADTLGQALSERPAGFGRLRGRQASGVTASRELRTSSLRPSARPRSRAT